MSNLYHALLTKLFLGTIFCLDQSISIEEDSGSWLNYHLLIFKLPP